MFVSFGKSKRLQFYSREHADKNHFIDGYYKKVDQDNYFFRPLKPSILNSIDKNGRLEALAQETVRLFKSAETSEPPIEITASYLRDRLKHWLDGGSNDKEFGKVTLSFALNQYIQESIQQKAANSTKNDKQLQVKINGFLASKKYRNILISSIDQAFADEFQSYLLTLELLNNSVAKHLRCFKAFVTWCESKGWMENKIKLRVKENIPEIIFLDEVELKSVENAEINSLRLDRVRDIFIFGCYTGMRISDIQKLKKSDYENNMVRYYETKGHKTISHSVPIVGPADKVVKKYWDLPTEKLLPKISDQKYNEYLKELLKAVEINKPITIAQKRGGKVIETTLPKYKLASSHLARKTFITRALIKEMPESIVKSVTGHAKNSRAFARYFDIADNVKSQSMEKYFGNFKE